MNVLQVLTYVSPSGDFGGPVRVAANQAAELRRRGHDVHLLAGARGYRTPPASVEGTPATVLTVRPLVPGAGVSGLANPALLGPAGPLLDWADVVHVNLGRDLVTMPVAGLARLHGRPLVVQTHGMIDPSDRLLARPLDGLLTRRLLRSAGAVLYLTEAVRADLEAVVGRPLDRAVRLPNGLPPVPPVAEDRDELLVLFAARFHPQKRPEVFVDAAAAVLAGEPRARFVMVGPDGGSLAVVRRRVAELGLGRRVALLGPLPHEALLRWFARAGAYVLPSTYEPFGMTALEAMAMGCPVVVTPTCGLAPALEESGAGLVAGPNAQSIAGAVLRLLGDPDLRARAGAAGRGLARDRFAIEAVVDRLEGIYRAVTGSPVETRSAR